MQSNPPLTGSTARRRAVRFQLPRLWLILPIILAVIIAIAIWQWQVRSVPTAPLTGRVTQGDLTITISGSGTVQASRMIDLPFQQAGQVQEVLVKIGDHVKTGQALAQLDPGDLTLQLQQAQANLDAANAKLIQSQGGGATAQDLAIAQAQLNSAKAGLDKTRTGNATPADIQSAQASLASAQARLNALRNPSPVALSAAQLKLSQAQTSLQNTRDNDSQAKTNAELSMQNAVNNLTQTQSKYSTAQQNWQYVQDTGNDPANPSTSVNGNSVPNKVTDAQRQQYYDTFVQAQASLSSSQNAVQQAKIAYDAARQKEATDIPQAEAALRDAQQQYDAVLKPTANDLIQAQATVTQAQASLAKLRQGGTPADITQSESQLAQAQANFDKLTAPAGDADLASIKAQVKQAEVQLNTAKRALALATLRAPFDGDITTVAIVPGGIVSASTVAVGIVDRSALRIDMNLGETDAARVQVGQPVLLTFDAIPELQINAKIEAIAPAATVQQNVVTYLVRAAFDPGKSPVKVGMSASSTIQVQQIKNAVLVPSRAVQTQNGSSSVTVLNGPQQIAVPVRVTTGVTNNGQTVIVDCADTGNQCLQPNDVVVLPAAARTSTTGTAGRGIGPNVIPFGPGR
jgi:HlyD family secretion protein